MVGTGVQACHQKTGTILYQTLAYSTAISMPKKRQFAIGTKIAKYAFLFYLEKAQKMPKNKLRVIEEGLSKTIMK